MGGGCKEDRQVRIVPEPTGTATEHSTWMASAFERTNGKSHNIMR